jgi:hypothetical protein
VVGVVIHVQDYSLAGNPVNMVAAVGSSTSSTLTLQSLNGYAGNVSLTYAVQAGPNMSPGSGGAGGGQRLILAPPSILPIVSINPQSFQFSLGGTQHSTASISLPSNLPTGNYFIIVNTNDGTLSRTIVLTIVATDFSITATPNSVNTTSGSNTTITLNLQSLNFFQGNVALTVTSTGGGPTGTLSTSIVQLSFYSNVNLDLIIHVPSNTTAGDYLITVEATSGSVSHTLSISIRVTAGGFVAIMAEILSPHNSPSISAMAIFILLGVFSTLKIRTYQQHKPMLYRRRRIENYIFQRSRTTRLHSYSSSIPPLWRPVPRDEY